MSSFVNLCRRSRRVQTFTHWYFLLCNHDRCILASHRDRCVPRASYRLECIFYPQNLLSIDCGSLAYSTLTDLIQPSFGREDR